MSEISDDFGESAAPEDKQEPVTELGFAPDWKPRTIELEIEGRDPAAILGSPVGGAYVRPVGKNANRLTKPVVPPFAASMTAEYNLEVLGRISPPEPEPLDLPVPPGVTDHTERNLRELRVRLAHALWAPHPVVIDRWVAPHERGVAVEMGYTHGEVWVRAIIVRASDGPRVPLWTQRIHGWRTEASDARQEAIFRDLMTLASSYSPGSEHEVAGAPKKLQLGFVLLTPTAQLPTRTYPGDAGFDLYVCEDTTIKYGEFVDVPLGVSVGLPEGFWGRITGRSSTLRNRGLLVNEGIIDTGYTGPLFAGVMLVGKYAVGKADGFGVQSVTVKAGDRIAQLILHANSSARFEAHQVDGHPETDRGTAGFGSSGD